MDNLICDFSIREQQLQYQNTLAQNSFWFVFTEREKNIKYISEFIYVFYIYYLDNWL